ncbi:MAG: hypothetical protein DCF16_01165 [Alphaproteobacteria bacterium]|nr:MAG: hypothetical protein DCF16_01165 [Alphaproteobacteria bacterium]
MNERQRDLFLYVWSQRRKRGQAAVSLMGAGIGAAGGVLFTVLLVSAGGGDRGSYTGLSAIIPTLTQGAAMLAMAVPAFAFIGFVGANRVYASQEAMYQSILATGAQIPSEKPVMQPGDRGPALAVAIAVGVIATFIIVLFAMYW